MGYSNHGRIKTIVLPITIPSIPEGEEGVSVVINSDEYFKKYGIDLKNVLGNFDKEGTFEKMPDRSLVYLYFNRNEGALKNPESNVIIPQYELIQNSLSDDAKSLKILKKTYFVEYSGDTIEVDVEYSVYNESLNCLYISITAM